MFVLSLGINIIKEKRAFEQIIYVSCSSSRLRNNIQLSLSSSLLIHCEQSLQNKSYRVTGPGLLKTRSYLRKRLIMANLMLVVDFKQQSNSVYTTKPKGAFEKNGQKWFIMMKVGSPCFYCFPIRVGLQFQHHCDASKNFLLITKARVII